MRTAIISATMVCLVLGQITADDATAAAAESASPTTTAPDDQAQQTNVSSGAKEESAGLQEITVTATRRSERASDVPVSVAAFDQQAMENLGIKDIADLNLVTPGLSYKPYFRGTSLVAIRGIYSNNGAATTGVYIDDTPVQNRLIGAGANATNIYPDVFDLERVEVLRGPQGTLFGASSEGGNIRFITAQPSLTDYSGHARSEISYTENGAPSYEIGAAGGGPIVPDVLGFRISAYNRDDGGWIDREPYPGTLVTDKNVNTTNTTVVNAALTYAPTPNLTITPSIFYQRIYQGDLPQYWRSLSDPSAGDYNTGLSIPESSTDKFSLPALKIQWNLGSATLFSNTSYLDRTRDNQADYSSVIVQVATGNYVTPGNIQAPLSPVYFQNPQKTFTQEVRLQSSDDNARVTWVTGLFYQAAKQDAGEFVYSPNAGILSQALYGKTVAQEYGEGLLANGLFYAGVDTAHDDQKALFGQVDGKITDALTATLGVRVARLSSDFTNAATGAWNGGSSSGSGGVSESAVTPKYGLSYKLTPDWLVYTSASKGFRPGGGNPPVSGICGGDLAALGLKEAPSGYKSDSVWSYEVGTKGTPMNGRLNIDGSVYYIKWSGIQQEVPLQCGFGYTANDGEAISRGFDLHAAMSVFSSLILGISVGYDDAYYTKTIPLPGSNQLNLVTAGDRLNTAPWKALGTVDYTFTPFADLHAYLHADYDYSNGYNYSTNGLTLGGPNDSSYDPQDNRVFAQRLASARLGVKLDSWDVSLFVKNLFNSTDLLYTTHQPITSQLFEDETFRPRTIGLTATLKF